MRITRLLLAATAFAGAVACGGGGPRGPQPLQHKLDDMHIARIPVSAKQDVVQAQNEFAVARMEHSKASSDLEDIETTLRVAKNEREQAVLSESSAQSEKEAADRSNDMNRINRAARKLRVAELERRAADEKVEYLEEREKALEAYVEYTEEDVYAKEAQYEYAKAQVARDNAIQPRDFEFSVYKQQAETRQQRALEAKARADQAAAKAADKRKAWQTLVREAERARGGSTEQEESAP